MKVEHRFAGLQWGEKDGLALIRDYDRDRRWSKTYALSFRRPGRPCALIWDRSVQDRYRDPGTPLLRTLPNGKRVMWQHGDSIFLAGAGASPEGDRPFLDRFDLTTLKSRTSVSLRRTSSTKHRFALMSDDGRTVPDAPRDADRTAERLPPHGRQQTRSEPLTRFTDPTPQIRGISKRLVTYKRADGVPLSFTLYLPPNHKPGERLPTVVWAYPLEFNTADTAGPGDRLAVPLHDAGGPVAPVFPAAGLCRPGRGDDAGGRRSGDGQQHVPRSDRRQREGGDRQGGRDGRDRSDSASASAGTATARS